MPQGFRKDSKALKLKNTLYDLRQSLRMFWKYLTAAMVKSGMQVSKLDPCLFVDNRVVCICYVDDILFWSQDVKYINELAEKLREQGLLLEQEDDAAGFLGVKLTKTDDGKIVLTQTGLTDRVIKRWGSILSYQPPNGLQRKQLHWLVIMMASHHSPASATAA